MVIQRNTSKHQSNEKTTKDPVMHIIFECLYDITDNTYRYTEFLTSSRDHGVYPGYLRYVSGLPAERRRIVLHAHMHV